MLQNAPEIPKVLIIQPFLNAANSGLDSLFPYLAALLGLTLP